VYRQAWAQILERLKSGDHVVLALAAGRLDTKRESSTLREVVERDIPEYHVWQDNPVTYREKADGVRRDLTAQIERLFTRPRADRSELIRSVREAGRMLKAETRRSRVLIILSDLLEDSDAYQFASMRLTDATTTAIITRTRASGLPTLAQVDAFTVVPGTVSPTKSDEVERFWTKFLQASGASLPVDHFGTLAAYRREAPK
jgi:hypothetical protein